VKFIRSQGSSQRHQADQIKARTATYQHLLELGRDVVGAVGHMEVPDDENKLAEEANIKLAYTATKTNNNNITTRTQNASTYTLP
jgi:hypothetical protein